MAIYSLCHKDIDSPELAQLFFEHAICKRGIPDNTVTDDGTQFTSQFWTLVCSHMSTDHWLSTAFQPHTAGQAERQNLTMKQYLWAFCNYKLDNWVVLLPLAKFAYNIAVHTATRMTPFWANRHHHLVMQFMAPKQQSSLISDIEADTVAAVLEKTHQTLHMYVQEAQARQTTYAGGIEVVFEVGDHVWLSTSHFRRTRPAVMMHCKCTGLSTVSTVINEDAYKSDLPYMIQKNNGLHLSLRDRYIPPTAGKPPPEPPPMLVDDSETCDVHQIRDSKRCYLMFDYLIQWAGYRYVRTSWEPADNLGNAQELVNEFHQDQPMKPGWWLDLEEWDWTVSAGVLLFLLCHGSWTGINGISMGCYHLPLEEESTRAPIPPWGRS